MVENAVEPETVERDEKLFTRVDPLIRSRVTVSPSSKEPLTVRFTATEEDVLQLTVEVGPVSVLPLIGSTVADARYTKRMLDTKTDQIPIFFRLDRDI